MELCISTLTSLEYEVWVEWYTLLTHLKLRQDTKSAVRWVFCKAQIAGRRFLSRDDTIVHFRGSCNPLMFHDSTVTVVIFECPVNDLQGKNISCPSYSHKGGEERTSMSYLNGIVNWWINQKERKETAALLVWWHTLTALEQACIKEYLRTHNGALTKHRCLFWCRLSACMNSVHRRANILCNPGHWCVRRNNKTLWDNRSLRPPIGSWTAIAYFLVNINKYITRIQHISELALYEKKIGVSFRHCPQPREK